MLEEDLLSLDETFAESVARYQHLDIFNQYVPLRSALQVFRPGHRLKSRTDGLLNIEGHLLDWIRSEEGGFAAILADYGSGKTTLLQRIEYQIAKEYVEHKSRLKPLFIPLKEFHNRDSLDTLLQHCIRTSFKRDMPLDVFWRVAGEGQFVLLLDGFDEMSLRVDAARRRSNLLTIAPLLGLKSKALLTCRPSYFVTAEEYEEALSLLISRGQTPDAFANSKNQSTRQLKRRLDDLRDHLHARLVERRPPRSLAHSPSSIYELKGFDESQIDVYLQNYDRQYRETCGATWEAVKGFLLSIYDLSDLMQRPILLSMINETVLAGVLKLSSEGIQMGPSSLYEAYTGTKLEIEYWKGEARRLLSAEQRRDLAEAIAVGMFDAGLLTITFENILETVQINRSVWSDLLEKMADLTEEQVAADIQVCTFLTRSHGGQFQFVHRSFMEYFVAAFLKRNLADDDAPVDKRFLTPLPKEILYFLGGFGFIEKNVTNMLFRWYRHKKVSASNSIFRRNMIGAFMYSNPVHNATHFEDSKVTDIDVMRVHFEKPVFKNLTFDKVKWAQVTMNAPTIRNSNFVRCALYKCDVQGGLLSVTFQETESIEADVSSECELTGRNARFHRCRFSDGSISLAGSLTFEQSSFSHNPTFFPENHGVKLSDCVFSDAQISGTAFQTTFGEDFSGRSCTFEQCRLVCVQMSHRTFEENSFKGCSGIVFVTSPESDLATRSFSLVDKIFLVNRKEWGRSEFQDQLLRAVKSSLGDSFASLVEGHFKKFRRRAE